MIYLLFVFAIFLSRQYVFGQINMTEYLRMPQIYQLEDYDKCLMGVSPLEKATYCYVNSLIKPNTSSEIWKIIDKYSSDRKRFYRHDRLTRGICMTRCREQMLHFDYDSRMEYYIYKFENNSDIKTDPNLFTNALMDRAKYHKYATMCVNYELQKGYGLVAQTDIEFCVTNQEDFFQNIDSPDLIFAALFIIIIVVIVLSTLYDFHLKRSNLPHLCNREHYKKPVDNRGLAATLVSFSLPRNWYKLTEDTSSNTELSRDLRSINALRCVCMFGVILGHSALSMSIVPVQNTQYLESKYFSVMSMILINGANILQSYFAITGYLLSVQFMDLREKHKFKCSFFWKAIIYRYIRFTPVYLFMIFFNATWLLKLQTGPIWPHLTDIERSTCRKNWWTNLLYINNFVRADEPCIQHAWYLAADFQLIVVGTLIQMLLWRFPKYIKSILSTCVIASFIIPTTITYVNKFDGIFMTTPENQRYALWYDAMYHRIYVPFYSNFGSFLFGMIGGILYCKHKRGHIDLVKTKFLSILWWSLIPVAFFALLSGFIFYATEFEKPALWIGIYAAFAKNIWGIFGATIVTGIALNTGWVIKEFFRQPIFRTLGRLTFGAYLIHPSILRASFGYQRQPVYVSDLKIIELLTSTYFMAYFLSFLLCLSIELPFSVLQKQLFGRDNQSTVKTIYETADGEATKLSKNMPDVEMKNKLNFIAK